MRHRRTWLITRWSKKRRRAAAEAAAEACQEEEGRAARRRILNMATSILPVLPPAESPLLTRGRQARSRRRR